MKKNDWILLVTLSCYSFLFYQQTAGVNFLLFTIILLIGLLIRFLPKVFNRKMIVAIIGSIVSAIAVVIYGNTLSVCANFVSLCLLSGVFMNPRSSVLLAIFFSMYSYISAPVYMFIDFFRNKPEASAETKKGREKKAVLIVVPFVISLLFLLMYQQSNLFFRELLQKINFDFISWGWIGFTLLGFILLYGFYYHRMISEIARAEESKSNFLDNKPYEMLNIFGKLISSVDENFSGILMFSLLNFLLLLVNILDVQYLFIDHKLPDGIGFSQFVHQGIETIILSIVIAVMLILFIFRGGLNFYNNNKFIKVLAYIWIAQNLLMLVSTAMRNEMYINEFGLTYKRIGVYFYLGLAALGLITVFIKILQIRSNQFLFRINGWIFYVTLVCASLVGWDAMITNFNLYKANCLEDQYLFNLSDANLPELLFFYSDIKDPKKSLKVSKEFGDSLFFAKLYSERLYQFKKRQAETDWRSWNFDLSQVNRKISDEAFVNKIDFMWISSPDIKNLDPIDCYSRIKNLYIPYCGINHFNELAAFPHLEILDITSNPVASLKGIETLKELKTLYMFGVKVSDYDRLLTLKNLKELYVSEISSVQIEILCKQLPGLRIFNDVISATPTPQ